MSAGTGGASHRAGPGGATACLTQLLDATPVREPENRGLGPLYINEPSGRLWVDTCPIFSSLHDGGASEPLECRVLGWPRTC